MGAVSIVWDPLLPPAVVGALAVLAAVVLSLGLFSPRFGWPASGWLLRVLAAGAILAAIGNPSVVSEERDPLNDIAVVVVDRSASQTIGERQSRTDDALARVEAWAATRPNLELRVVEAPGPGTGAPVSATAPRDGTRLFEALEGAMVDLPRDRFAGALFITDGRVHDAPEDLARLDLGGPLHALVTGERDAGDRRLTVVRNPAFGIVGEVAQLVVRVDEPAAVRARQAELTIRRDGEAETRSVIVPVGSDYPVDLPIDRGGPGVFEISVTAGEQELTLVNNRAVVVVNGIRDRLRVLLVSGAPHPGERTWRNLLKADPSVDLVHFTILRPPEKQDGTPVRELSLIAFPYRELFEVKLNEFDLIVFDRYRRMGVLPSIYLRNIAEYVRSGGALLEATGPEVTPSASLYSTALAAVLPGEPTGEVVETPFKATVSDIGRRHPVTATLPGLAREAGDEPQWGRWFRHIEARPRSGTTIMNGPGGRPLLILDRTGEGRVAQFMSDHFWLWARGFEGGGPHAELLRRLSHWLMKEPELEEDRLTAEVQGGRIEITRRSLEAETAPVTVTFPSGREETVALEEQGDGRATGYLDVDEAGIYRLADGKRTAVAGVGSLNPVEFSDVTATDLVVRPAVANSGGGVAWLGDDGMPSLRQQSRGRTMAADPGGASSRWLAFQENGAFVVRGVQDLPLLPALILLALLCGTIVGAWRRESR